MTSLQDGEDVHSKDKVTTDEPSSWPGTTANIFRKMRNGYMQLSRAVMFISTRFLEAKLGLRATFRVRTFSAPGKA